MFDIRDYVYKDLVRVYMGLTNLDNLIKSRRSTRTWQDKEVPQELLLQAIELATWAPNGGNQQNWRFYVILNRDTIKAITDAVQASANQISSWPEADKYMDTNRMRERAGFFREVPAAIAVAASQYQSPIDRFLATREETDNQARTIRQWRNIADSRIQSVAAAIAYLLLILHQMGLGAVWMTGPMQAKEEIGKILKVPSGIDVVAFIPIGYPAETPASGERKPIGEVCEIIR
ncbi:nitroreductase family protein [Chloroflexota bacterium]